MARERPRGGRLAARIDVGRVDELPPVVVSELRLPARRGPVRDEQALLDRTTSVSLRSTVLPLNWNHPAGSNVMSASICRLGNDTPETVPPSTSARLYHVDIALLC